MKITIIAGVVIGTACAFADKLDPLVLLIIFWAVYWMGVERGKADV